MTLNNHLKYKHSDEYNVLQIWTLIPVFYKPDFGCWKRLGSMWPVFTKPVGSRSLWKASFCPSEV